MRVKCLAQEHNTMTRPGLEHGPLDPESSGLTTRPPRLPLPSLLMFNQSLFRAPYAAPVNWNFKTGSGSAAAKDRIAVNKDTKHIDVDAVGTVNGVSVHEFDLDSVDDKPWRKPGKSCDIHSLLQVMRKCVVSFELSESKVGKRDHGEPRATVGERICDKWDIYMVWEVQVG